jgi:D-3-phosphoglycerate dehydrogenase
MKKACASSIARAAGWSTKRAACGAEVRQCGGRRARRVRDGAGNRAHALFGIRNVVCTPHLGASTTEAQENVALQVAEQMSDYLIKGAISNAHQHAVDHGGRSAAAEALRQAGRINMVSAPIMAKERGIMLSEIKRDKSGVFDGYIKLTVKTASQTRSIAGTCFSDHKPRFIQIKGINLDAEVGQHMLYTTNATPGHHRLAWDAAGQARVNIANFQLGRDRPGGDAIALLYLDEPFPQGALAEIRANPKFQSAKRLEFDVAEA